VATIVQEFMTSPANSGWWEDDLRFYTINREQKYTKCGGNKLVPSAKKADLVIERYEYNRERNRAPTWIEAKRARLWSPNVLTGGADPAPHPQNNAIIEDMKRLSGEKIRRMKASDEEKDQIFTRILVWGVYDNKAGVGEDHPSTFFNVLEKKSKECFTGRVLLGNPVVRWFPTAWEEQGNAEERGAEEQGNALPIVTRAVWVLLAEVKLPDNEEEAKQAAGPPVKRAGRRPARR